MPVMATALVKGCGPLNLSPKSGQAHMSPAHPCSRWSMAHLTEHTTAPHPTGHGYFDLPSFLVGMGVPKSRPQLLHFPSKLIMGP